ncbi:circadian clock KaiB family protein [Gilvimarinus sp. F26214L]|uniref:circadian clock KaiB family protein n=1 Tax=Gilvimarinus sp. DZF01 TaxID=3461371 RepID=UPI0040465FDA
MSRRDELILELFVQGQSARSSAAVEAVRRICEKELGSYQLEVIDIHQHPERVQQAGIIATPALVRCSPKPILHTVGRLTDERIREGLGIDDTKHLDS